MPSSFAGVASYLPCLGRHRADRRGKGELFGVIVLFLSRALRRRPPGNEPSTNRQGGAAVFAGPGGWLR